jgi:hypothetical protein
MDRREGEGFGDCGGCVAQPEVKRKAGRRRMRTTCGAGTGSPATGHPGFSSSDQASILEAEPLAISSIVNADTELDIVGHGTLVFGLGV